MAIDYARKKDFPLLRDLPESISRTKFAAAQPNHCAQPRREGIGAPQHTPSALQYNFCGVRGEAAMPLLCIARLVGLLFV